MNKSTKDQIAFETSHVRTVLNDWNPIPGSRQDEYDCLVDHIVSALHRGVDVHGVSKLIKSEFHNHFGLPVDSDAVLSIAQRLWNWWTTYRSS